MRRLVLFFHPGCERNISKYNDGICPSSKDRGHTRKYMVTNGKVLNKDVVQCKFGFWGEWEGSSEFTLVKDILKKKDHPAAIHSKLNLETNEGDFFNTDPCVMGNMFLYSSYQQNFIADLKELEVGDILLFGTGKKSFNSRKKNKKVYDIFICDTVFVIKYKIENMPTSSLEEFDNAVKSNLKKHKAPKCTIDNFEKLKEWYYEMNIKCLNNKENAFYIGATYEDKYKGMFSYIPCKVLDTIDEHGGFERPDLGPLLKELPEFKEVREGMKGFGIQNINIKDEVVNKKLFNSIMDYIKEENNLDIAVECDFYD